MAKQVRFIRLELENFAGLPSKVVDYGDITALSGMNGKGKTSVGTGPVWTLYGVDLNGSKYNPTPTNYEYDRVYSSLHFSVDDSEYKFAREINTKGTNSFYINDVPVKAKEYEEAVASLFDKDEFLSLYNPSYFFTQHWTKQRAQIMKYTTPPANSEVFTEMSRTSKDQKAKDIKHNPQAEKLALLVKKHSLDDLQKIHGGTGGQKSKLEKQHIAAQSRTKTLTEQLSRWPKPSEQFSVTEAKEEAGKLLERMREIEKVTDCAGDNNAKINALNGRIRGMLDQREAMKQRFPSLRDEQIADTCRVCKQSLQGESIKAAEDEKQGRIESFKVEYDALVVRRKEYEEELAALEFIDVNEQIEQVRALEVQRKLYTDAIRDAQEWDRLQADVDKARTDEETTLTSLKESIFILDATKSFRAKEAEIQAEKVQSLFTTLKIRLFKFVKSSGEYEPDFSIQCDDKDYVQLSVGEKIGAGLELTEVLFKQSELIVPTFIDNIESYTGRVAVYGQLITGRVVADQELIIESEELTHE